MKSKTLVLIIFTIFLLNFSTSFDEEVTFTADQQWEVPDNVQEVDVFLVGGGGGSDDRQGSGGGYTETYEDVDVSSETTIDIQIGSGGSSGQDGEPSQFMNSNYQADGGEAPRPGDGGSGGGARGSGLGCHTTGGSDGGEDGSDGDDNSGGSTNEGGSGQGTTTRAFEDPDGTLYAGGGGGGSCDRSTGSGGAGGGGDAGSSGSPNTGGGGGEDSSGGSGIVKVRYEESLNPPDNPSNPSPSSDEDTVSLDTELEVDVSGDDLDYVEFEIDGETYTESDVVSGGTASVEVHELDPGETYSWSAEACNDAGCTSDSWSFTTIYEPDEPESPSPNDEVLDVPEDSDLEVDVSHPDGLDMDVTFRKDDGEGWSTAGTDTSVGDGETASINPDLELSETYEWYAEASAEGLTTESDTWSFETEHSFEVEDLRPEDDSESVAVDPVLEADIVHSSSEDEIEVVFYDGDGSELGTDSVSGGETASLDTEGLDFGGEPGEVYDWYVEAVDEQSSTEDIVSETQSFTTLSLPDRPEILSPEGSGVEIDSDFEVEVAHPDGEEMFVEITLETVDGEFVDDLTGDYEDTVIDNFDPELSYDTEYNLSAKSQVTDSNDNIHSSSNWEVFETELAPEELVSSETNNTDPNNAELDFSLDNSVQSIEVTDHGDETVGLDSDPDTQASIGLPKLEPDKEYEWTVEADTDEGPRTVDFNFTTIELEVEVDDVDSAESYNVYRSLEGEDDYELTSSGELEDSIVFDSGEGLEEGEVYCYKVSGVSEEGIESDLSDEECMEAETEVSPP